MLAILGALPLIGSIITGLTSAFFNAKVDIVRAKTGADRDTAIELVKAAALKEHESTAKLGIFASNPLLTFLLIGFATPLVLFVWKIVVVDIIIGPGHIWYFGWAWEGSTDPIKGQVADWATTIIGCLFGSSTVLAAGKMYFSREQS
jgi:hypothetical protein